VEESSPKFWASSVIKKTDQSEQSPNRRNFAQSGHHADSAHSAIQMNTTDATHLICLRQDFTNTTKMISGIRKYVKTDELYVTIKI
jgi:hypothetical protein